MPANRKHWCLSPKPRIRSRLRLSMGKIYFTWKRYLDWLKNSKSYARYRKETVRMPYLLFTHQTPLMRNLQNVDICMQKNKIINLQIAVACISGIIINPGETFSFWYLIGRPTRRKGYQKGMVLCNGSLVQGIGGGLCQLSNLLYWMVLHSPLTVSERWRHNYDVFSDVDRKQPFGSGATVVYNYVDLQIRNDTNDIFQLLVWLDEEFLYGELRSNKDAMLTYYVYEKEHWITPEWWGGYMRHNNICRKVCDLQGKEIEDNLITENHAIMMYEPLLSSGID